MRLMQHKKEAYWFYRFLSIFYDDLVNPLFWTEPMREKSLTIAGLDDGEDLKVIDVAGSTKEFYVAGGGVSPTDTVF